MVHSTSAPMKPTLAHDDHKKAPSSSPMPISRSRILDQSRGAAFVNYTAKVTTLSYPIILSLTFWGLMWGIPGMFLSVPIMVIFAIVCSRFDALRGIAVILSADGRIAGAAEQGET